MDYLGFLIVLQLYEIIAEGRFVDVTVKLASNMQLECIYPKNTTITQMSWIKCNETNKEAIATFHPSYGVYIDDKYKDRVYIVNASSEDKSLYFTKTSAADTGFYSCSIQTFPDGPWEKIIQVIQSDVFDASMPQPQPLVTGLGENLLLMCLYNLGGSVQHVKWEKIQRDRMDTIVLCSWSGEKTFGSNFQQRTLIDCTPHVNNTLIIKNFTASDSGIYRCVATGGNKMDVMSFNVMSEISQKRYGQKKEVDKSEGLAHPQSIFFIAGGAAAAFLLLIILLIIIISTVVYHRKKKRRRIMTMSKTFYSTQNRPMNSYGRSHFVSTPNSEREGASTSRQTEDIYVNYRNFSR